MEGASEEADADSHMGIGVMCLKAYSTAMLSGRCPWIARRIGREQGRLFRDRRLLGQQMTIQKQRLGRLPG